MYVDYSSPLVFWEAEGQASWLTTPELPELILEMVRGLSACFRTVTSGMTTMHGREIWLVLVSKPRPLSVP
jgi:hypothetical protein